MLLGSVTDSLVVYCTLELGGVLVDGPQGSRLRMICSELNWWTSQQTMVDPTRVSSNFTVKRAQESNWRILKKGGYHNTYRLAWNSHPTLFRRSDKVLGLFRLGGKLRLLSLGYKALPCKVWVWILGISFSKLNVDWHCRVALLRYHKNHQDRDECRGGVFMFLFLVHWKHWSLLLYDWIMSVDFWVRWNKHARVFNVRHV